jgi:hypothetical protein
MSRNSKRLALPLSVALVAAISLAGVVVAAPGSSSGGGAWPYAALAPATHGDSHSRSYVLAAVGDVACEPDDPENAGNPASLKCGASGGGGFPAEYATADQTENMKPDLVALLGDEQYEVGKLSDFESSFDKTFGAFKFLQRPSPGNHDYYAYTKHGDNEAAQDGDGYFAYYNGQSADGAIRPHGQAGSYNEGWYSYDLGAWHIVSLNAECNSAAFDNDCSTTDDGQLARETRWLAKDLQANHSRCTMAYWHQPTFSATTGAADAPDPAAPGAGSQEGQVADAWWKLLYADHASLILNGHEHVYARFRPMNPAGKADPRHGIPQFTIGTGGEDLDTLAPGSNGTFANPNVVTGEDSAFGVTKLTLGDGHYSWSFRPAAAGPGFGSSSLSYRDSGTGSCQGAPRR